MIHLININNIEDNNYKNVLMSQYFYLKSPEKENIIINSAIKLYNKVKGNPHHFLYSKCCDFELPEKACNLYPL